MCIGATSEAERHSVSTMALVSEMSQKRKSTFGLRRGQLADLFAIAAKDHASTEADGADEHLAERLRNQLMNVIPGDSLLYQSASEILENEPFSVTSLTGRSLQELLFSSESSVEQLQVIKEVGKRMTTTSTSEAERAVATTIYHAAIAGCLVNHNKKISQHSYDKLDESFVLLMGKKWMADELVELFSQARNICQRKQSKK